MHSISGLWKKEQWEDYEIWHGETSCLRFSIIPAQGSNAISLQDLATGREWLYHPAQNGRSYGNRGYGEKYYFQQKVTEGWAAVYDPITGEKLTFRFPPEQVPYLAVWANYGRMGGTIIWRSSRQPVFWTTCMKPRTRNKPPSSRPKEAMNGF